MRAGLVLEISMVGWMGPNPAPFHVGNTTLDVLIYIAWFMTVITVVTNSLVATRFKRLKVSAYDCC